MANGCTGAVDLQLSLCPHPHFSHKLSVVTERFKMGKEFPMEGGWVIQEGPKLELNIETAEVVWTYDYNVSWTQ